MLLQLPLHQLLEIETWLNAAIRHSPWLFASVVILALSRYGPLKQKQKQRYAAAPITGVPPDGKVADARERFRQGAQSMLLKGYEQYKGRAFYVPSPLGERLMLPARYVEELKNATDDRVDFVGAFFEMFEGRYTTMGSRSTLHPRVAKLQLNQHMETVLEPLYDEIQTAFNDYIPPSEEWVEVSMATTLLLVVARASSRMFGGLALSRNRPWLDAMSDFASDGFIGAQKIKRYRRLFRPLVAPFIPELRRIHKHYDTARREIVPLLDAREKQATKPSDFLQWMVDDAQGEELDRNFIADILLKMSFAALHTSAATPMQLIYDLCVMPEYIAPLRAEVEEMLATHGRMDKQGLLKLQKLDSFMKESLRFNPLLLTTFERVIIDDYRLSDGFLIPAGTTVGVPAQAISMDPDLFPDPTTFDGFRFEKVRATSLDPAVTGRTQWAASNLESMAFGYGRHACPGRFFAANEIKQIMAHLLLTYDFEFAEGTVGRPENLRVETQMIPNREARIRMRRRRRG